MLPFVMHAPELLSFEPGPAAARRLLRALRHARGCARCRPRVERLVLAQRFLERGSTAIPTALEEEALLAGARPAVLGAAGASSAWWRRPRPAGGLLLLACSAALALVVASSPREELRPRGEAAAPAVVRLFCAEAGRALAPVLEGGRCPRGATLALAAGARPPLTHVSLRLRGGAGVRSLGTFAVTGAPGAEQPLQLTPPVLEDGAVVLEAVFGASEAEAAAGGPSLLQRLSGARAVRRTLRFEAGP